MDAIFDFFNQGWVGAIIGLVGVILAVVSIWLAYHFYRRSRQGAQLAYHHRTIRVLGAKGHTLPEAVKITFRDRPIDNLCRSLVLIWNNSDKTIYGKNIVESDWLRIDMGEGAQVLDARIVKRTREVNQCTLSERFPFGESDIPVGFDYLDSGDGYVVEVFHTESDKAPKLLGSIHEMPRGFRDYGRQFPMRGSGKFMRYLAPVLASVLAALAVWYAIDKDFSSDSIVTTTVTLAGAVFFGSAAYVFSKHRRRYRKALSMPEFYSG